MKKIGIVGAGIMGNGIAQVFATAGFSVILCDVDSAALARATKTIQSSLTKLVTKEKISTAEVQTILGRITPTTKLEDLKSVDVAIEAASENLDLKIKIFRELDATVQASAILATNTSSISITKLAGITNRHDKVIGMHFMNPVPLMSLVEIILGKETSPQTHQTTMELISQLKKTPITAKDRAGFVINRILGPMLNEAITALHEDLASAKDIDLGMKLGCNFPMGPLELADFIGLDTLLAILEVMQKDLNDPKFAPSPLLREHVAAGRLGRKSGKGFYSYDTVS